MKVSIDDLKKAIKYIETNSNAMTISLEIDFGKMYIDFMDKYQVGSKIILYEDANMLPKVQKEDLLK